MKDRDFSVEDTMACNENTECSLISLVQQAAPVAHPAGQFSPVTTLVSLSQGNQKFKTGALSGSGSNPDFTTQSFQFSLDR